MRKRNDSIGDAAELSPAPCPLPALFGAWRANGRPRPAAPAVSAGHPLSRLTDKDDEITEMIVDKIIVSVRTDECDPDKFYEAAWEWEWLSARS